MVKNKNDGCGFVIMGLVVDGGRGLLNQIWRASLSGIRF
jgi:hypothetical protein